MKRLAIIGAGGHGKVVGDAAERAGWDSISFFDDFWTAAQCHLLWPVSGTIEKLLMTSFHYDGICIAIGNNQTRLDLCQQILIQNAPLVSVIHPAAVVSSYAELGIGSVVFAGAVINPGAKTGIGCILNTGASVDHDCILGNAVHISPGAHLGGNVVVGDMSWIGIGASVKQKIKIGRQVMVGAGAAVVNDVPDDQTFIGVPASKRM